LVIGKQLIQTLSKDKEACYLYKHKAMDTNKYLKLGDMFVMGTLLLVAVVSGRLK
jgi:hypothetical protein